MRTWRVQLDWRELEVSPGVYDEAHFRAVLADPAAAGFAILMLVATADTGSMNYPEDLMNEDGSWLRDGLTPDDPALIARFNAFLDWAMPIAKEHGVYCISVGNEPDTHYETDPNFIRQFIRFVAAVRGHAHTVDPDIAITYTSTSNPATHPQWGYAGEIADAVDVLCFNLYGVGKTGGIDFAATETILDEMIALADGKPVIMQEFGCSSLLNPDRDFRFFASSPALQRDYFAWFLGKLRERPQVRAAYQFQIVENGPIVDQFYSDFFGQGLPPEATQQIVDWLDGLGLIEFDSGAAKPAWDAFVEGMGLTANRP